MAKHYAPGWITAFKVPPSRSSSATVEPWGHFVQDSDNLCSKQIWPFLFCFSSEIARGTNFFELFAKVFWSFRPRENFFDSAKILQNLADSAAIRLVQKSSKSEPSSPFFGRLKFRGKFVPCELLQNPPHCVAVPRRVRSMCFYMHALIYLK